MKTKVILASSSKQLVKSQLPYREEVARTNNEITIIAPDDCPSSTETEEDEVKAAPAVLAEAKKAEEEGFDAVTVDCALDVAVDAAKNSSELPVVGAGEAAFSQALVRGGQFSVIVPTSESIAPMTSNIHKMGLMDRLASVRSLDIHVLDLDNYEKTLERLEQKAKELIAGDQAEVIVLGCTVMGPIARRLEDNLKIPVIEPASAAIKMAEGLVDTG